MGDLGLIPGLGKSLGGGHGNPLQYSSWRIAMDRGAWWTTVNGILQARILVSVAFPYFRGSSQPRDQTQVSQIAGRFFTI